MRNEKQQRKNLKLIPTKGVRFRFGLVEIAGFEPATYTLRTYRAANCAISPYILQDVNPAILVGTNGLEPSTSCMSSKRSDQLSYAPEWNYYIIRLAAVASFFGAVKTIS